MLLASLSAPLALALVNHARLLTIAGELPWYVWLAVAPVALIVGGSWLLCLCALAGALRSSFRATNWIVKTTDEGLYLNLRSYQNRHFPDDAPTVAFLRYAEIDSVRAVRESYERGRAGERSTHNFGWLELRLLDIDTRELAELVQRERTRQGPERRCLGIRGRTRSNHVPVLVSAEGLVRVERVSRALLRELGKQVRLEEPREVDLDLPDGRGLEQRVRDFLARGERFAAIELVRHERNASLTAAHELVREIERGSARPQRVA